jgi:hypothetical protein
MPDDVQVPADVQPSKISVFRRFLWRCLCWSGAALVLYVLSIGPVVRLMFEGTISEEVIEAVYAPITWLGETKLGHDLLEPFVEWYGEKLWGWGIKGVPVGALLWGDGDVPDAESTSRHPQSLACVAAGVLEVEPKTAGW